MGRGAEGTQICGWPAGGVENEVLGKHIRGGRYNIQAEAMGACGHMSDVSQRLDHSLDARKYPPRSKACGDATTADWGKGVG